MLSWKRKNRKALKAKQYAAQKQELKRQKDVETKKQTTQALPGQSAVEISTGFCD